MPHYHYPILSAIILGTSERFHIISAASTSHPALRRDSNLERNFPALPIAASSSSKSVH